MASTAAGKQRIPKVAKVQKVFVAGENRPLTLANSMLKER